MSLDFYNPVGDLRVQVAESPEWQTLLHLFDLNEGFALVILLVPDNFAAGVCANELRKHPSKGGRTLRKVPLEKPEDMKTLS